MSLKPYQRSAVEWMKKREEDEEHPGGVQCDEVGLGKTIMMLSLIKERKVGNNLIIAPKSLLNQWYEETKKWYPEAICIIYNQKTKDINKEIVLVSQSLFRDETIFHTRTWDRIIIDEGHSIKNPKSKIHNSILGLESRVHWLLTATPIMNKMVDYYGIMRIFGYGKGECNSEYENIVRKMFIRRTKKQLEKDDSDLALPNLNIHILRADMNKKEKSLYETIQEYVQRVSEYKSQLEMLELYMRLVQICVHPQIFYNAMSRKHKIESDKWETSATKFVMLKQLLDSDKRKTLVFCKFREEMDTYSVHFPKSYQLNGSMSMEERSQILKKFNEDDTPVLFLQEKVGSCGLNLQIAQRIIITSPNWCPPLEYQAIGRAHRTGQKNEVDVYKLVLNETIESTIIEKQEDKIKDIQKMWELL